MPPAHPASGPAAPRVGLVQLAMRRPITMAVLALSIAMAGLFSLSKMQFDIFPALGTPSIYVVEPYGGLDPGQIESYITYNFETHFLYCDGIKNMESQSIDSLCLIKLSFQPGTDMAAAMAQVVTYASRARKMMPPGTLPPFILRFDSGDLPVGDLIFSSTTRPLGVIQDYAMNEVRPLFATLPGISAPPPFGSSPRTIVIDVDPAKLREYDLSPRQVVQALAKGNHVEQAGNLDMGNFYPIIPINAVVTNIHELENIPVRVGTSPTVFIKDVGTVEDSTDIQTGYAELDGRRTLYIPVTKHSDASTLTVVKEVKAALPRFQSVLPPDIKVSYAFDQSGYVINSIRSLASEGLIGALLTGLMVLLFLQDWRSSVIVVANIPLSLLGAIVGLRLAHQTVNIMTLGGLALAIGILVDQSTVTIENIHVHLDRGSSLAKSCLEAASEIFGPNLLTLLCILAVFIPAFFMVGMAQSLFIPLTLAVGFSVLAAFLFSMTIVPVLSTWLLPEGRHGAKEAHGSHTKAGLMDRLRIIHGRILQWIYRRRWPVLIGYTLLAGGLVVLIGGSIGREIFPTTDSGELQLRMRAPTGTRIEVTEQDLLKVLGIIKDEAGPGNVSASLGFVGTPPPDYAINAVYLWSSGPQEAILQVELRKDCGISTFDLQERLRKRFKSELPDLKIGFEASGLVDKVLNAGTPTPVEIAIAGRDINQDRAVAERVREALKGLKGLRDVEFGQPFRYPTVDVNVDRKAAGIAGATIADIGKSIIAVTASSQFVRPNYWTDPATGASYIVQVEVPETDVTSVKGLRNVPVTINGGALPLHDFASVTRGAEVAEYDRLNMQRLSSVTANISGIDLGHASVEILKALAPIRATLPRGTILLVRGQVKTLGEMVDGLAVGLGFAVVVIILLLAGSFESLPIALIIIFNVTAVLAGSLAVLYLTGSTLNIESFMGTIMSIGVSVANAVLLITFADQARRSGHESWPAAVHGAQSRLRPILMTAIAMIVGMIPMALGLSESGKQTAPLARAVIGGLAGSTVTTLLLMPVVYAMAFHGKPIHTASLDPIDPSSKHFEKEAR